MHDNGKNMAIAGLWPGLTLVATPIGNLADLSARAIAAFNVADLVLCEDTRVSRKLFTACGVRPPVMSYHDHNAESVRPRILARLRAGERVVLVSDAGTPTIADPGYRLVQACIAETITVSTVPGPTALVAALAISGLPTDRFYFGGFLPPRAQARRNALEALKYLPATIIHYESPRRLAAALADAACVFPSRRAAVAREITKLHEEVRRGTVEELRELYTGIPPPRGEAVLLIGPPDAAETVIAAIDLDAALSGALAGASLRDAVQLVADQTGLARSQVYRHALRLVEGKKDEA